jgi:hypothetical protein
VYEEPRRMVGDEGPLYLPKSGETTISGHHKEHFRADGASLFK